MVIIHSNLVSAVKQWLTHISFIKKKNSPFILIFHVFVGSFNIFYMQFLYISYRFLYTFNFCCFLNKFIDYCWWNGMVLNIWIDFIFLNFAILRHLVFTYFQLRDCYFMFMRSFLCGFSLFNYNSLCNICIRLILQWICLSFQ